MKRFILLSAALMLGIMLSAQTQQGYVKTKGRMVNGQLVPGQGLKGATVCIKGKTAVLVNKDDGAFSFPVPETQFRVDSVRKKGYQLVDMDALSKTYKHSANPIYLVMETPEQKLQDQLAAERKIRRTLTDQLHQREDEIEALKEQQKISDEEYRQALQKLYEETGQNEQLVKDMVERYSTIDYDQLSEFDQRISELILNGELTKADSMLRTKGDINQRAENYQRHKAINSKEKEELTRRQASLELSETAAQKERDDLANDCYRKFEIFKMQHLNDSAAYYIELRAGLDTTNAEWLIGAGYFIKEYLADYEKAIVYYETALRQSQDQLGKSNELAGNCYNSIGIAYDELGDFEKSLTYFHKGLNKAITVFGDNHPEVASIYSNIGNCYSNQGKYEQALEFLENALEINISSLGNKDSKTASNYNNIAMVYMHQGHYAQSLEYLNKALEICKGIYGEIHPHIADCYNNIGSVYMKNGYYDESITNHEKALFIRELFFDIHPDIAASYNNIGAVYLHQKDFGEAIKCFEKALTILEYVFGKIHPNIATTNNNLGYAYKSLGDYDKALEYYKKDLEISNIVYSTKHPNIAICYFNIGTLYKVQGDYSKAMEYYEQALPVFISTIGENHPNVATLYSSMAAVYSIQGEYFSALNYYNKSLTIRKSVLGDGHPSTINTHESIAKIQAKLKEQENEPKNEE